MNIHGLTPQADISHIRHADKDNRPLRESFALNRVEQHDQVVLRCL